MHYTVEFKGTPAQKQAQAIKETKQWMGAKRFKEFSENFRALTHADSQATRLRRLHVYLDFAGVRGRGAVHAVYRHIVGVK